MTRKTISVCTDVDVDLDDFSTEKLVAELRHHWPAGSHDCHQPRPGALIRHDRLTAMDELINALEPSGALAAYKAAQRGEHPFLTVRPQ